MTALPQAYTDPGEEYAAVRTAAGLVDRRDWGLVEVTGRDRGSFLHALLSNEVKALEPGQGCRAALLNPHGKVEALLLVWVLEDRVWLVTPPGQAAKTLECLDHYLFSEKVVLRDASEETALLLLAGPEAPGLVERLTGVRPAGQAWAHVVGTLAEASVRMATGGGETGGPEVWVAAPAADSERVKEALVEAGARPVGADASEALRIEAGSPRYGPDVDDTVLLPEIPAEALISHSKGCYPGQEVVVRIRDRGHVNRHLVGLVLEGEGVPPAGAEVVVDDAPVGRVTSAAWSFGLRRPVALAFVRRQQAAPDAPVGVRDGAEVRPARVSTLPFTR